MKKLLTVIALLALLILCISACDTTTPAPAAPAPPTATPDANVLQAVNNLLGSTLIPPGSITVSGDVVTINRPIPLALTTDPNFVGPGNCNVEGGRVYYKYSVSAGIQQVYYDEKKIWEADPDGLTEVIAINSAFDDSNCQPIIVAKADVSATTAKNIQWDSLTPEQAWNMYDLNYQYAPAS